MPRSKNQEAKNRIYKRFYLNAGAQKTNDPKQYFINKVVKRFPQMHRTAAEKQWTRLKKESLITS